METLEQLKQTARDLSKQTVSYHSQGLALIKQGNLKEGHALTRLAYENSKKNQQVIAEILRREAVEGRALF
jgi:hypothetical protein